MNFVSSYMGKLAVSNTLRTVLKVLVGGSILAVVTLSIVNRNSHTMVDLQGTNVFAVNKHLLAGGGIKFRATKSGTPMSYAEVLAALSVGDATLSDLLTESITSYPAEAVFWECAPVTAATVHTTPFEYVILPSAELASIQTDINPFGEKFQEHSQELSKPHHDHIITFRNLGRDARLVVPAPYRLEQFQHPPAYFAHIAAFMRGAERAQIAAFWQAVGTTMLNELRELQQGGGAGTNKKLWLSTSGLGVSWLHVRIDSVPKYYNHREYKYG